MKRTILVGTLLAALSCSSKNGSTTEDAPTLPPCPSTHQGLYSVLLVEQAGGTCGPLFLFELILNGHGQVGMNGTCTSDPSVAQDANCHTHNSQSCDNTDDYGNPTKITETDDFTFDQDAGVHGNLTFDLTAPADQACKSTYTVTGSLEDADAGL